MHFESFASLSEAWGHDESSDLREARELQSAPTCKPSSTSSTSGPVWCDLYYKGFSNDIDNIMDMYTPGDAIPEDVRFDKSEWSQAGGGGVSKRFVTNEVAATPTVEGNDVLWEAADDVMRKSPRGRVAPSSDALSSNDEPLPSNVPFPYEAYDPSAGLLAPFPRADNKAGGPRRPCAKKKGRESLNAVDACPPSVVSHQVSSPLGSPSPPERRLRNAASTPVTNKKADVEDFDDYYSEQGVDEPYRPSKEGYYDHDRPKSPTGTGSTLYVELAMYVLSGLMLILLMEQFVQIGLNMR